MQKKDKKNVIGDFFPRHNFSVKGRENLRTDRKYEAVIQSDNVPPEIIPIQVKIGGQIKKKKSTGPFGIKSSAFPKTR